MPKFNIDYRVTIRQKNKRAEPILVIAENKKLAFAPYPGLEVSFDVFFRNNVRVVRVAWYEELRHFDVFAETIEVFNADETLEALESFKKLGFEE